MHSGYYQAHHPCTLQGSLVGFVCVCVCVYALLQHPHFHVALDGMWRHCELLQMNQCCC